MIGCVASRTQKAPRATRMFSWRALIAIVVADEQFILNPPPHSAHRPTGCTVQQRLSGHYGLKQMAGSSDQTQSSALRDWSGHGSCRGSPRAPWVKLVSDDQPPNGSTTGNRAQDRRRYYGSSDIGVVGAGGTRGGSGPLARSLEGPFRVEGRSSLETG